MRNLFLLILVMFSIMSHNVHAQQAVKTEDEGKKKGGHGLGLILSSTNGKGLCYRYWPGIYGVHVSFVPADMEDRKYYNGGITGYARIKRYSIGDLFLHLGGEYVYRSRMEQQYDYMTGLYNGYRINARGINVGFGPGFHVTQKGVSFDIYAGYGGYMTDESSDEPSAALNDRFLMTFTGGIAMYLDL